jgi:hypothetical protein
LRLRVFAVKLLPMYELWLLSLYYRILKAIVQFISKHWVLILFAFFLGVLAGIAVGSFFIALYALLHHRKQPQTFNTTIFISLGLCIFGFYCLTTDFYKEFPTMYKATAIGNGLGLMLTAVYFIRFALSRAGNNHALPQPLLIGLIISSIALLLYNHFVHVSDYLMVPGKQFHMLLLDEKRAKYRSDFEAFESSHYKLDLSDERHFTVQDWVQYGLIAGTIADHVDKRTLLITGFDHLFEVIYYTNSKSDGVSVLTYKAFLNGIDADYNGGHIIFPRGETKDMDFDKVDYEQEMHTRVLTEIAVQAHVIPDDLDSYIEYREKGVIPDFTSEYLLSEAYMRRKGIPFRVDKF